jgi:hypothetical protein
VKTTGEANLKVMHALRSFKKVLLKYPLLLKGGKNMDAPTFAACAFQIAGGVLAGFGLSERTAPPVIWGVVLVLVGLLIVIFE